MQFGSQDQRTMDRMIQARQEEILRQPSLFQPPPPSQQHQQQLPSAVSSLFASRQHQQHQQQQQHPPEPFFVTRVGENDVLQGRGTPCSENEGNVRFRGLIKHYKGEYNAADRRSRKDAIAREIIQTIAARGGKFLRKVESQMERDRLGVPRSYTKEVWTTVEEDTQLLKAKQALRNKDDLVYNDEPAAQQQRQSMNEGSSTSTTTTTTTTLATTGQGNNAANNQFCSGVKDDERDSRLLKANSNIQFSPSALDRHATTATSTKQGKFQPGSIDSDKKRQAAYEDPPGQNYKGFLSRYHDSPAGYPYPETGKIPPVKFGNKGFPDHVRGITSARSAAVDMDTRTRLAAQQPRNAPPPWGIQGRSDVGSQQQPPPTSGLANQLMRRQQMELEYAEASPPDERRLQAMTGMERARMHQQMNLGMMEGLHHGMPSSSYEQRGGLLAATRGLDPSSLYGPAYHRNAALLDAEMSGAIDYPPALHAEHHRRMMMEAASVATRRNSSYHPPSQQQIGSPGTGAHPTAAIMGAQPMRRHSSLGPSQTRSGVCVRQSSGERAVELALAMKRAEAFSAAESFELSHSETLIISVLISFGLPVWTPSAHTESFVRTYSETGFRKKLAWNWAGFANAVKCEAFKWEIRPREGTAGNPKVLRETIHCATEYEKDPRQLAITTVMLLEKLRRHGAAAAGMQHRAVEGRALSVSLWLERELSRWATTLEIAAPGSGLPMPFSSADFVLEQPQHQSSEAVIAVAAFDAEMADDAVQQVALLSRLRSIFTKNKPQELRNHVEEAAKRADSATSGNDDIDFSQDILLCDRLLADGFSAVLTSVRELDPAYQFGSNVRPCPAFHSLNLTKFTIQHRVNKILQELHALETMLDTQRLLDERMDRMAKSVGGQGDAPVRRNEQGANESRGHKATRFLPSGTSASTSQVGKAFSEGGSEKRKRSSSDPEGQKEGPKRPKA